MKHCYEDEAGFIDYIKDKKLFLWGAGKAARDVVGWLLSKGISSFSFVDANPKRWGQMYENHLIYSPDDLFVRGGDLCNHFMHKALRTGDFRDAFGLRLAALPQLY